MFPIFELGPFTIGMYGVCCTIGIALAILLAFRNSRFSRICFEDMIILAAVLLIGAFVGAKLLYLIVEGDSIAEMFRTHGVNMETLTGLLQGGFVFYGGFIGGFIAALLFAKTHKIKPMLILTIIAPSIPLAHAFGRVGCFMAGCCYGMPSEKFGIAFTQSLGAPNGIKLFPVQLLEAALLLLLAIAMQLYFSKGKHRHCAVYIYLFVYPIIRIITERFRYDDSERGIYFGLSTSTWISLGLILMGLIMLVIDWKKGFPEPELPPEPVYEDESDHAA